jgi:hypothetical protein
MRLKWIFQNVPGAGAQNPTSTSPDSLNTDQPVTEQSEQPYTDGNFTGCAKIERRDKENWLTRLALPGALLTSVIHQVTDEVGFLMGDVSFTWSSPLTTHMLVSSTFGVPND